MDDIHMLPRLTILFTKLTEVILQVLSRLRPSCLKLTLNLGNYGRVNLGKALLLHLDRGCELNWVAEGRD